MASQAPTDLWATSFNVNVTPGKQKQNVTSGVDCSNATAV